MNATNTVRADLTARLPVQPEGQRFWRITHNPKSRVNPIRLDFMECQVPGKAGLSRSIGFELTIASPKALATAAELIEARVGDYDKVVGDYGI